MKKRLVTIIILLFILLNIIIIYTPENKTKGTNVSGNVSGIWTPVGSPYIVTDYINITPSDYLDIRPGVEVRFNLDADFEIWGILYANGTKNLPIRFRSNLASPYEGCWGGLLIEYTGIGLMQNCTIAYARNGINATANTKMRIKNCEIYRCINGTNFDTVSVSKIENCEIHDNLNNGFRSMWGMGLIKLMNNTFYKNTYGIRFEYTFYSTIFNNTIYDNTYGIDLFYVMNCVVNNNTIINSNLTPPVPNGKPPDHCGINIYWARNTLFHNNTIINTSGQAMKVRFSYNNSFENNYIENASGSGIYIFRSVYNTFIDNTIIYVNHSAILIKTDSNGNIFQNNKITKYNDRFGIEFLDESIWNTFDTKNKINNVPLRFYFNVPGNTITSDLTSFSITEPLMTNLGQVVIIDSSNFEIRYSTFASGQSGIYLYNAHNATLENLTFVNLNDYAVFFGENSTDIKLINSTINIPVTALGYFYLGEDSNVSVLNTAFDQSKVSYSKGSNLTIQWFLHVRVYRSGSTELIPGANVKVYDKFGTLVYNGTTSKDGSVMYIVCTDKIKSDKQTISFNRHNVTVFKLHYQLGYAGTGVNMDRTRWTNVYMIDNRKPTLTDGITPLITHDRTPTLSWIAGFDLDNDKLLYWVNVWNNNQPTVIIEVGSSYDTEYTVKTNLTFNERYRVNVTAYDGFGGWSNTIKGYFDLVNRPPSKPEILIIPEQTSKRPSKNEDLNCTIQVKSVDIDVKPVDIIKYNFLWYKNGIFQENLSVWNSTDSFHVLDKKYTATGDIWSCNVTATDGYVLSPMDYDSREIMNSVPDVIKTVPKLKIPEDTIDQTSINLMSIFYDEDNEPLTFDYSSSGDTEILS